MKRILITGAAGFIGFHLVERLLKEGYKVMGIDNINHYYDVNLKYARLAESGIYSPEETDHSGGRNKKYKSIGFGEKINSVIYPNYTFIRLNLEDKPTLFQLFETEKFEYVVNLAAQAGVRYSIENPDAYVQSNVVGFLNILEACRHYPAKHLIYASSSSVYGSNAKIPFSETDQVDHPVSLYAATKKSNELMAHTYSHLYHIPTTGLRFFTVYGPWGRPDMAPMLFAHAISNDNPIQVYNNGDMERDFTYMDDIVEGITRVITVPPGKKEVQKSISPLIKVEHAKASQQEVVENPKTQNAQSSALYRILNIGNGSPVNLLSFIKTIEQAMGKKVEKNRMPMQPGDVKRTWANTNKLEVLTNYRPQTSIEQGVGKFTKWFKNMYTESLINHE